LGSEHESDASDDDEYVDDLPEKIAKKGKAQRSSVSSEAFGLHNKQAEYVPPKYEKSEEIK
jgi:hypothetical protein